MYKKTPKTNVIFRVFFRNNRQWVNLLRKSDRKSCDGYDIWGDLVFFNKLLFNKYTLLKYYL